MPSRRSYHRSHNGCQNCKARRVKCDEQFPCCLRCQKRGEECSFSQTQVDPSASSGSIGNQEARLDTSSEDKPSSASKKALKYIEYRRKSTTRSEKPPVSSATPPPASRETAPQSPATSRNASYAVEHGFRASCHATIDGIQLDALDHVLFEHYVSSTYCTLNEHERVIELFGTLMPKLAREHWYLMHSLLAIAGAHCLSTVSGDQPHALPQADTLSLRERTLLHQDRALTLFSAQMNSVDWRQAPTDHCVAMCLACVCILLFNLSGASESRILSTSGPSGALGKAIELLRLTAGVAAVFYACWSQLERSELSFLLDDYQPINPYGPYVDGSELDSASLKTLRVLCSQDDVGEAQRNTYNKAIAGLQELHDAIQHEQRVVGARLGWIRGQDAQHLAELLEAKRPEALLILAHWAACLDPWPGAWWESGFSRALVADIICELPREFQQHEHIFTHPVAGEGAR